MDDDQRRALVRQGREESQDIERTDTGKGPCANVPKASVRRGRTGTVRDSRSNKTRQARLINSKTTENDLASYNE